MQDRTYAIAFLLVLALICLGAYVAVTTVLFSPRVPTISLGTPTPSAPLEVTATPTLPLFPTPTSPPSLVTPVAPTPTPLPPATPTSSPTPTPEPSPTGPTPTAAPITMVEELVGLWFSGGYSRFKGDGTYRLATSPDTIEDRPYLEGEFWFEGGQLFVKDSAGIPGWDVCVGRPAGSYEVQGAVRDYFILVAIDDPCETRVYGLTKTPFEWVSP